MLPRGLGEVGPASVYSWRWVELEKAAHNLYSSQIPDMDPYSTFPQFLIQPHEQIN